MKDMAGIAVVFILHKSDNLMQTAKLPSFIRIRHTHIVCYPYTVFSAFETAP